MMMEEEEEEEEEAEVIEHVFIAHEIDLDYEFDAPRFFDFTRPETLVETHQAQLWFQNAATYPPSPFVRRLMVREDLAFDDASDSPKSQNLECTYNVGDEKPSVPSGIGISNAVFHSNNASEALGGNISSLLAGILQNDGNRPLQEPAGLSSGSKTISGLNLKAKSAVPKSSRLMQPTASQLAKQTRVLKIVGSRYQKLLTQNEMNLSLSSGGESQAAKRQKLEGGLLRKATDVKQQANFVHKRPMRAATIEQNSACSKLKLTIPREPNLKTAYRAQRMRPKNVGEAEHVTVVAPRFKARPLNRKILEAPSLPPPKRSTPRLPEFQEFHLKTLERAMQHTSGTSSFHYNDPDEILPSKGDAGFQNREQETIAPMEFDLPAEKGVQPNPPIDLFSKLSLTSEGPPNNGSQYKLPQHSGMCRKEKAFTFGANQIPRGKGGYISMMRASRSLGIR